MKVSFEQLLYKPQEDVPEFTFEFRKCIRIPWIAFHSSAARRPEPGLQTLALVNDASSNLVNQPWQRKTSSIQNKSRAKHFARKVTIGSGTNAPFAQTDVVKIFAEEIFFAYTRPTGEKVSTISGLRSRP